AVVFDLLLVPSTANAEQKASARNLIERGDELGGLDSVALDHKADAGGDFEPLGSTSRGGQGDKGVHYIVVALAQLGVGPRAARHGDVRMLGGPDRIKAALLHRGRQLGRSDRVIGEKDRGAEFHRSLSSHAAYQC